MPSEREGFTDDGSHPVAGLSVDAGVSRWTCTRSELIDALANIEARPVLISDRTGMIVAEQMADAILGQLPEAGPDSRDSEITRLRQALADKDGEIAILKGQVTS